MSHSVKPFAGRSFTLKQLKGFLKDPIDIPETSDIGAACLPVASTGSFGLSGHLYMICDTECEVRGSEMSLYTIVRWVVCIYRFAIRSMFSKAGVQFLQSRRVINLIGHFMYSSTDRKRNVKCVCPMVKGNAL